MKAARAKNYPGDSECSLGLVHNDGRAHVCQVCGGNGCPQKGQGRAFRTRRRELFRNLSGSTVFRDQKGRAVFVDLEKGTAYVLEE